MLRRCEIWSPAQLQQATATEAAGNRARQMAAQRIWRARARSVLQRQTILRQATVQSQSDCERNLAAIVAHANRLTADYCRDLAGAFSLVFEAALKAKAYPEWISFCVNKVRHELDSTDFLQLRVHPQMLASATEAISQLASSQSLSVKITVRADSSVLPGETVVASGAGLFSIKMAPFLQKLEQALEMSLVSSSPFRSREIGAEVSSTTD